MIQIRGDISHMIQTGVITVIIKMCLKFISPMDMPSDPHLEGQTHILVNQLAQNLYCIS